MSVADAPRPVVMDRVEVLAPEWLEGLTEAWNAGFGTKMCCACCPGSESVAQVRRRYAKYKPDKWEMGAVAVAQEGTVLGFVQMGLQGQPLYPEGLHTVKEVKCIFTRDPLVTSHAVAFLHSPSHCARGERARAHTFRRGSATWSSSP